MSTPFAIRQLGRADVERFQTLRQEAVAERCRAFVGELSLDFDTPDAKDGAPQPETILFGGVFRPSVDSNALFGGVGLSIAPLSSDAFVGTVFGLTVRQPARGLGLGRALLEACVAHARSRAQETRLRRLDTAVAVGEPAARRLFERLGFRRLELVREAHVFGGEPVDVELLSLRLPGG